MTTKPEATPAFSLMNMHRLLLILSFLLGGCVFLYPPDARRAETLRLEAESMILRLDYADAAEQLAAASRHQPENGALYLRRGEVLERIGEFGAARRSYKAGLQILPAGDSRRAEMAHRLALLLALRLNRIEEARSLLPEISPDSPRRDDLLGVLSYVDGRPREALQSFNAALGKRPADDLTGAILYHAALAYQSLGDEKNLSGALYEAINRATNLAVTWEIEKLWTVARKGSEKPANRHP